MVVSESIARFGTLAWILLILLWIAGTISAWAGSEPRSFEPKWLVVEHQKWEKESWRDRSFYFTAAIVAWTWIVVRWPRGWIHESVREILGGFGMQLFQKQDVSDHADQNKVTLFRSCETR